MLLYIPSTGYAKFHISPALHRFEERCSVRTLLARPSAAVPLPSVENKPAHKLKWIGSDYTAVGIVRMASWDQTRAYSTPLTTGSGRNGGQRTLLSCWPVPKLGPLRCAGHTTSRNLFFSVLL